MGARFGNLGKQLGGRPPCIFDDTPNTGAEMAGTEMSDLFKDSFSMPTHESPTRIVSFSSSDKCLTGEQRFELGIASIS
jgi:hypothetical protein